MEVDVGENPPIVAPPIVASEDNDQDGFTRRQGDCDDDNPDAGPSGWGPEFVERCDRIDNDCDGIVDESDCAERDSFLQRLQLDALFVIDTSVSMQPHIALAADGAADFLQHIVGPAFDTHIGVITMDPSQPELLGQLVSVDGRQFIEGDDPKFTFEAGRQWLRKALAENPTVTGSEPTGRAAVDAALVRDDEGDWNQGFLRYSGMLQLILVSNSEDGSGNEPSQIAFLESLDVAKGNRLNVAIHAITQLDDYNCDGVYSEETRGDSYLSLVQSGHRTGTTLSVCAAEYGTGLSAIGQYAALEGLENEFALEFDPQPETVEVTLNLKGVYVDYELGAHEFTLDGRTLIIRGDPPPAGTSIAVTYTKLD